MKQLAIFASGSGSNAEAIVLHFRQSQQAEVALIVTNRRQAGVRERAERLGVPCHFFTAEELREGSLPLTLLRERGIDLIILAGYMSLLSPLYIKEYPDRILNIHPALLPAYGGQGMYGAHVHRAVLAAGERESGITIHLVNERYDEGRVLLQATCPVLPDDSPEGLAQRVHALEHRFYAQAIAQHLEHLQEQSQGKS